MRKTWISKQLKLFSTSICIYLQMIDLESEESAYELIEPILDKLQISDLKPIQELIIHWVLEKICFNTDAGAKSSDEPIYQEEDDDPNSRLVILPTGFGKTLCYQVPILLSKGSCLIISPLKALMFDQQQRFEAGGAEAIILDSSSKIEPSKMSPRFFIASPELLQNEQIMSQLENLELDLLVVDEAHLMTQWGESFRPAFQNIPRYIERLKAKANLALTATPPRNASLFAQDIFPFHKAITLALPERRPEIDYRIVPSPCPFAHLLELLWHWQSKESYFPMICFVKTREEAERYAGITKNLFFQKTVFAYHGGMDSTHRSKIESLFLKSNSAILFASCAYGTGIDKKNVRTVIHLSPPPDPLSYLQESGRAGRDGNPAKAILFVSWKSSIAWIKHDGCWEDHLHRNVYGKDLNDESLCACCYKGENHLLRDDLRLLVPFFEQLEQLRNPFSINQLMDHLSSSLSGPISWGTRVHPLESYLYHWSPRLMRTLLKAFLEYDLFRKKFRLIGKSKKLKIHPKWRKKISDFALPVQRNSNEYKPIHT